jgi:hypothetical protein
VSAVIADIHVRLDGGMRLQQLVTAAMHYGWPKVQETYEIKQGGTDVKMFLSDLLASYGPLADLLVAIADANARYFDVMEEYRVDSEDETFPDVWQLEETAEPLVRALAYVLACMGNRTTIEEWEASR